MSGKKFRHEMGVGPFSLYEDLSLLVVFHSSCSNVYITVNTFTHIKSVHHSLLISAQLVRIFRDLSQPRFTVNRTWSPDSSLWLSTIN